MDYSFEQYKDFPIFILTSWGKTTVEVTLLQYKALASILDHQPQHIYLLVDNTLLDFTFIDMMQNLKLVSKGGKGLPSDKRIKRAVFISQNHLISIFRDFVYKLTGSLFPVFASKEEGIEYLIKQVELDHAESTTNNG